MLSYPTLSESIRVANNKQKLANMQLGPGTPAEKQLQVQEALQGSEQQAAGGSQQEAQGQPKSPEQWNPATSTDVDPVTGKRFWKDKFRPDPTAGLAATGGVRYEDPAKSQARRNDMFYQHRKPQGMPQGMV